MTKNELLNLCCQLSHELAEWHKTVINADQTVAIYCQLEKLPLEYDERIGEAIKHHDKASELLYKIQTNVALMDSLETRNPISEVEMYA